MKQKRLNEAFFERNIPPASEEFERRTMDALGVLALREEEKPMKRKSFTAILVMALILVLLAATALAVGLSRSARYDAQKAARAAFMEKYGITQDTIGIFWPEMTEKDGVWTVTFAPNKFDLDAIGTYTVVIGPEKEPVVRWSHDDMDPAAWQSGALDAPAWGYKQLEAALVIDRAYNDSQTKLDWDNWDTWTLESRAAADQVLADAMEEGMSVAVLHVAPGPDDIQEDEAIAMAGKIAMETYGLSAEYMQQQQVRVSLLKYADEDEKQYRIDMSLPDENGVSEEWFWVRFFSPSGKGLRCTWFVHPENRTLPEGPLTDYEQATKEFVEEGAFVIQPPAKKADIAARIIEAGWGDLINNVQYEAPGDRDALEADVLATAKQAMIDTFGFNDETLALFAPHACLVLENSKRVWAVDYITVLTSADSTVPLNWDLLETLGEYRVTMDAETGDLLDASWSLAAERGDKVYTENTWGQAPALDAKMLPWAQELLDAEVYYVEKYRDQQDELTQDWSLQDWAEHDQRFRDAGFDSRYFNNSLPAEGELTMEEAIEIAKKELMVQYGLAADWFDRATILPTFSAREPEHPEWLFSFQSVENGRQDDYGIGVDAKTGEVTYTGYVGVANG